MWSHEQTVPVIQRGLGSGVSLGPSWLVCAREPSKTQEEHADSTHTHTQAPGIPGFKPRTRMGGRLEQICGHEGAAGGATAAS